MSSQTIMKQTEFFRDSCSLGQYRLGEFQNNIEVSILVAMAAELL